MKILIVEDEYTSRVLLKEMLSEYGDCHVASNGSEGLELVTQSLNGTLEKFDLVCLDIMMPEKSGHDILHSIRKIEQSKNIKPEQATRVMMITSMKDAKNVYRATIENRCHAYLTKPVNRERLEREIDTLQLFNRSGSLG